MSKELDKQVEIALAAQNVAFYEKIVDDVGAELDAVKTKYKVALGDLQAAKDQQFAIAQKYAKP